MNDAIEEVRSEGDELVDPFYEAEHGYRRDEGAMCAFDGDLVACMLTLGARLKRLVTRHQKDYVEVYGTNSRRKKCWMLMVKSFEKSNRSKVLL